MANCKIDTRVVAKTITLKFEPRLISVGMDVAMETLMICKHYDDGKNKIQEIQNTETGIKRLANQLNKINYGGRIIMESTGRHHMLSAIVLSENNLDVRVINPLLTKKYSTASIRKVKTDKRDSEILAEIGIKESKLPNSFKMDRKALVLKKKMKLIYSMSKHLQNLSACSREHKKTLESLKCKTSPIEQEVFNTIALLKKQKEQLEAELENDIRQDEENQIKIERYDSIPGVSPYVAALASLIFSDEYSQSAKQWIAFIGMDVSVAQSAKWTGKGRLTKRGDNYLRMRFYTAAWGAVRHNEKFKEYYDYLKKKNRKHREALIIISRKIIGIMFRINKNNEMYDALKPLFASN